MLEQFISRQEPESIPNEQAPIRALVRYMKNRPGQFNTYQLLINNSLSALEKLKAPIVPSSKNVSNSRAPGGKNNMPIR